MARIDDVLDEIEDDHGEAVIHFKGEYWTVHLPCDDGNVEGIGLNLSEAYEQAVLELHKEGGWFS